MSFAIARAGSDARAFSLRTCQRARSLDARSGEDTLEFECREVPTKGDRLLWQDGGIWREHVVVRTDVPLEDFIRMCMQMNKDRRLDLIDEYEPADKKDTVDYPAPPAPEKDAEEAAAPAAPAEDDE